MALGAYNSSGKKKAAAKESMEKGGGSGREDGMRAVITFK